MPIHRRRFRIEEAVAGDMPMPIRRRRRCRSHASRDHERTARDPQPRWPRPAAAGSAAAETIGASVDARSRRSPCMLETYRAQIEQCEKLKVELDLIYDAINRTKREIAVLHGKSFNGEEMARVNGELGAVVGGTEEATQQILEAAEVDRSGGQRADQGQLAGSAEAAQRGNPGARRFDLRGLQFPGSDRSAHQEGDDHDEVHRKSHHRHDGHLGRRRRDQGACAADRRYPRRRRQAA